MLSYITTHPDKVDPFDSQIHLLTDIAEPDFLDESIGLKPVAELLHDPTEVVDFRSDQRLLADAL
ncbi:hypothetical protein MUU53_17845 [Rhizobium lemnae]|uniref:Uncharacterized protein n=1 Tax=Rhizobium lemnae TaxID=1214924 RepID=A0ABV8E8H1_9HYPH|nr:hypothetical protein [Rhizobium lemnae]MCJ8509766.1 hypothetical protein [Rhizobium lemnae]